jgi:putative lipoic acid-binding regulatory protein
MKLGDATKVISVTALHADSFPSRADLRCIGTINPDAVEKTMTFVSAGDANITFTVSLNAEIVTVVLPREVAGDVIMDLFGLIRHPRGDLVGRVRRSERGEFESIAVLLMRINSDNIILL